MEKIKIKDDYIKLGQALKLAGLVSSGIDAKFVVQDGQVKVNVEKPDDTVVECLLKGYTLKGKVIRAAKVIVNKLD